jgi:hypothetical protein
MKRIYLACPYSHHDARVREARFKRVNVFASMLMKCGDFVFSPISHTHPIAEAGGLPGSWEYWEPYDRSFLEWADELHVLMLPGWKESIGVQAEIRIAQASGKPVKYIESGLYS